MPKSGIAVTQFFDGNYYQYVYGDYYIDARRYDFRVDADSTSGLLDIYVNDTLIFAYQTSTPYRTGLSGLWSGNEVGYFDDFSLTSDDIPPVLIPINIDIKPLHDLNRIDLREHGMIRVAIFSTDDFDAPSQVDRDSLTFGTTGDEDSLSFCNYRGRDVNGDGLKDLVCHFFTQDTSFQCGDTEGVLKGMTIDGTPIEGRDSVRIVPCKNR